MKKLILVILVAFTLTGIGQTLEMDGKHIRDLPVYDVSGGDTEFVIDMTSPTHSFKWNFFLVASSLTGTLDGTLAVYYSSDNGSNWLAYPDMASKTLSANGAYGFDDYYSVYDKIKIIFTANSITGGTFTINERLITNPNK